MEQEEGHLNPEQKIGERKPWERAGRKQESHGLFRKEEEVHTSKLNQSSETALQQMKMWGKESRGHSSAVESACLACVRPWYIYKTICSKIAATQRRPQTEIRRRTQWEEHTP